MWYMDSSVPGTVDSARMANVFMDDEPVLPLVLRRRENITVKLDDVQQVVSGTPLNDKLFGFFKKYQQLQSQQRELVHKHNPACMNGSDMQAVTSQLNAEAMELLRAGGQVGDYLHYRQLRECLGTRRILPRNHGQPVPAPMLSPWIENHEQGYRALQERSIRKGLLPESTGKPGYHERYHEAQMDPSMQAGQMEAPQTDPNAARCTNA